MTQTLTDITVPLDARFDLNEAGRCTCGACCDAFAALYEQAAEAYGESCGLEVTVVRCTYGSPEAYETTAEVDHWQAIHDRVYWGPENEVCRAEQEPIEIADDDYDCFADQSEWRFSLYLDPEVRRVSHHRQYGAGTPMSVYHGRALLAALPRNAVGQHVEEIVRGDEFRELVEELFSLYDGSEWDGHNHVGRWSGATEYESRVHDLESAIEALFADVTTYCSASDWLCSVWGQDEADSVRSRMAGGETLDAVVEEMVQNAWVNSTYLDESDVLRTLESLLAAYPAVSGDEGDES